MTERDVFDCRDSMYITAHNILKNVQDAEDVVQDALILAIKHLHQFDPTKAKLNTWCCTITRNEALMLLRANGKRGYHNEDDLEFVTADESEYRDIDTIFNKALEAIKGHKGLAKYGLNDAYVEYYSNKGARGRNIAEYAEDFDMNPDTLRTVFARATKDIHRVLSRDPDIIF